MHQYIISNLVLLMLLALLPTGSTEAGSLSVTAGVGYDYFSQTYRLDSFDSLSVDSLDATLNQLDSYFDDFKGKLRVEYAPGARGSMLLTSWLEQSGDDLRFRAGFDTKLTPGRWQLMPELEFDLRNSANKDRSYWYGSSRNRLAYQISPRSKLKGEFRGNIVRFSQTGPYNRDYARIQGSIGYQASFGSYSSYSISLFQTYRNVPDSVEWNYRNLGTDASLFWLRLQGETEIMVRYESKDYEQPDDEDDFTRFELLFQNRTTHSNSLAFKQLLEIERVTFTGSSLFNFDYTKLSSAGLVGYQGLSTSIAGGPWVEWLFENGDERSELLIGAQDYRELGLRLEAVLVSPGIGYASVEMTAGRRNLTGEVPVETDFDFVRTDLLLDSPILDRLKAHLLLSAEWEFHTNSSENIRVILFSTGLNYSF